MVVHGRRLVLDQFQSFIQRKSAYVMQQPCQHEVFSLLFGQPEVFPEPEGQI